MQYRRRAIHAAQALTLAALLANGTALGSTAVPAELAQLVPQAQPAGSARLTWFGLPIYDANLWVAPGFRQSDFHEHGFAIELKYLRALRSADIAERSIKEMRRIESMSDAQAQQWLSDLRLVLRDVQPGDRITGIHRPGRGVTFLLNGQRTGDIGDLRFGRAFFSIWLARATREPALRAALVEGTAP